MGILQAVSLRYRFYGYSSYCVILAGSEHNPKIILSIYSEKLGLNLAIFAF